jgi:hypothetical protein
MQLKLQIDLSKDERKIMEGALQLRHFYADRVGVVQDRREAIQRLYNRLSDGGNIDLEICQDTLYLLSQIERAISAEKIELRRALEAMKDEKPQPGAVVLISNPERTAAAIEETRATQMGLIARGRALIVNVQRRIDAIQPMLDLMGGIET